MCNAIINEVENKDSIAKKCCLLISKQGLNRRAGVVQNGKPNRLTSFLEKKQRGTQRWNYFLSRQDGHVDVSPNPLSSRLSSRPGDFSSHRRSPKRARQTSEQLLLSRMTCT